MKLGNKVFTINYLISYALTNSTHSIEYKEKENITIEDIFSEIGIVEGSKFSEPSQLQENWAIDIARNKHILGGCLAKLIGMNYLLICLFEKQISHNGMIYLLISLT